jgi:5-methylcytosine-specific restriction protein A
VSFTSTTIVRSLRRYERETGDRVTQRLLRCNERPEWLPSETELRPHFATLTDALLAAGSQVSLRTQRWDKDGIIKAMRAWHARTGKAPTARAWTAAAADHPAGVTVRIAFGSWQEALEAAELASASMPTVRLWDQPAIISALNRWAGRTGSYPRKGDWDRRGNDWPPASVVRDAFGNWKEAVDAAQEQSPVQFARPTVGGNRGTRCTRRTWTEQQIVAAARKWKREKGEWPKAEIWQRSDAAWPRYRDVRAHFAAWGDLLQAAGAKVPTSSAHRRRALPYAIQLQVFERDGSCCLNPHCDKLDERLTCDHIVAVACGGTDALSNLQTLCGTCNSRKGKLSQKEFNARERQRLAS